MKIFHLFVAAEAQSRECCVHFIYVAGVELGAAVVCREVSNKDKNIGNNQRVKVISQNYLYRYPSYHHQSEDIIHDSGLSSR